MKLTALLCGATFVLAVIHPAAATEPSINRGEIAQTIVRTCSAAPSLREYAKPEVICACMAGVISAHADDRQLYIMSRVLPVVNDEAGSAQVERELFAQGFVQAEFDAVTALLDASTVVTDSTCWVLGR